MLSDPAWAPTIAPGDTAMQDSPDTRGDDHPDFAPGGKDWVGFKPLSELEKSLMTQDEIDFDQEERDTVLREYQDFLRDGHGAHDDDFNDGAQRQILCQSVAHLMQQRCDDVSIKNTYTIDDIHDIASSPKSTFTLPHSAFLQMLGGGLQLDNSRGLLFDEDMITLTTFDLDPHVTPAQIVTAYASVGVHFEEECVTVHTVRDICSDTARVTASITPEPSPALLDVLCLIRTPSIVYREGEPAQQLGTRLDKVHTDHLEANIFSNGDGSPERFLFHLAWSLLSRTETELFRNALEVAWDQGQKPISMRCSPFLYHPGKRGEKSRVSEQIGIDHPKGTMFFAYTSLAERAKAAGQTRNSSTCHVMQAGPPSRHHFKHAWRMKTVFKTGAAREEKKAAITPSRLYQVPQGFTPAHGLAIFPPPGVDVDKIFMERHAGAITIGAVQNTIRKTYLGDTCKVVICDQNIYQKAQLSGLTLAFFDSIPAQVAAKNLIMNTALPLYQRTDFFRTGTRHSGMTAYDYSELDFLAMDTDAVSPATKSPWTTVGPKKGGGAFNFNRAQGTPKTSPNPKPPSQDPSPASQVPPPQQQLTTPLALSPPVSKYLFPSPTTDPTAPSAHSTPAPGSTALVTAAPDTLATMESKLELNLSNLMAANMFKLITKQMQPVMSRQTKMEAELRANHEEMKELRDEDLRKANLAQNQMNTTIRDNHTTVASRLTATEGKAEFNSQILLELRAEMHARAAERKAAAATATPTPPTATTQAPLTSAPAATGSESTA